MSKVIIKEDSNMLGDCYDASAKYVLYEDSDAILVHGTPLLESDNKPFGHAWVEKGSYCIDVANGHHIILPKEVYYSLGHIKEKETYKYSRDAIMRWILKTEHWDHGN